MRSKLWNSYAFFSILSVIIMYLGFSLNLYKATDYERYYDDNYFFMKDSDIFSEIQFKGIFSTFDRYSESLVIGRLVKSRKNGLLSSGGFVGYFIDNIPDPPAGISESRFLHAYQYKLYLNESLSSEFNHFQTYRSQSGGQAFFLGVLDRIILGKNSFKLAFYYHLMAAISTIIIFLIILWFAREFGLFTGWLLVISFSLFCYPTLFAKSLWWILWAFYIPFLLFLYMLRKEELLQSQFSNTYFIMIGFCGMIIKIFFNGFEFITTTFFMALIPLFYYGFKNRWDNKRLFNRLFFSILGISLAIAISFMLLSLQFVFAGDSFGDGLKHIEESYLKRTQMGKSDDPQVIALEQGVKGNLDEILKYYILYPVAVDFRNYGINRVVRIKYFIILFMISSFMLIYSKKIFGKKEVSSSLRALIITLWLAIIPPLSWFVIFKQHSIIHQVHNPIVWYMPYMLYGVALSGIFLKETILRISVMGKNWR